MPKAARSKAKTTKKVAPKRVTRSTSRAAGSQTGNYYHQRDQFFQTHPNARMLLAILALAIAIYIGASIWGQAQLYSAEVANPGSVQVDF